MKKALIIIFALIANYYTYSQSWAFEEQNISKKFQDGSLPQEEITNLVTDWRAFKAEYGEYPNLPFNERNEIEYIFIFKNQLKKEIIFKRILEWAAISFGSLESVLHYNDLESGKIILKGTFKVFYKEDFLGGFWGDKVKERVTSSKSNQTYIFTIKDNNLKIQVVDVDVIIKYGGYLSGTSYIQSETLQNPISNYYPISNFSNIFWKSQLNLLSEISSKISIGAEYCNSYINSYQNDYDF